MDLGIKGKAALVCASGGGLGLATARRLAMEGCSVALCDKDESRLPGALEAVRKAGAGRAEAYPVDLTRLEAVEKMVGSVRADLGRIDILVNNSGGPPPGTFDEATDEKWLHAYHLTFLSAVRMIRLVLPDMKAAGWGRIVNFTSRALREPISNLMLSNAVRLAVGGMAKTLAAEVASYGITVNNICPGPTSTDRAMELAAARAGKKKISVQQELELTAQKIPRGRLATPEEQAAAAAFLASDLAGHITGISLLVDGGETRAL
ncbi:MAG: SDR family oxidoreductase [Acidobacteria bacterium]|nr:SDR family oxidoreductase [Acidobacteriota bacterium]